MVQAEPGLASPVGARPGTGRPRRRALVLAGVACCLAVAAYVADVAAHPIGMTLGWFDLNIYNNAGLITRHAPETLYTWQFLPGVKYLYTPFAALGFAAGSLLPWAVLKWLMTVASLAAMAATVWFAFGQLGWRGRDRSVAFLAVSAAARCGPSRCCGRSGRPDRAGADGPDRWDLCQPDERRWKGVGVGVAAGIKLVPLIFIPYLILAGKIRQAVSRLGHLRGHRGDRLRSAAMPLGEWWLTGYFLHAGDFSV
jgi:alpha-1,2-mannosyltransferase